MPRKGGLPARGPSAQGLCAPAYSAFTSSGGRQLSFRPSSAAASRPPTAAAAAVADRHTTLCYLAHIAQAVVRMRRRDSTPTGLLLACCMAAQLAQLALAAPTVAASAASAAVLAAAPGAQLTISGLQLEGDSTPSSLQLQRQDIWSPGAQVVLHTGAGEARTAPPPTRWFTGSLAGTPGSLAVLAVNPDGRMTGTASRAGTAWSLATTSAGPTTAAAGGARLVGSKAAPVARPTTAAATQPAGPRCGNKGRMVPPGRTSKAPTVAAAVAPRVRACRAMQGTCP